MPQLCYRLLIVALFFSTYCGAQVPAYPYPVHYFPLVVEKKEVKLAYMDIPAANANGNVVLLFHGKNFNGYYWKDVIPFLTQQGYRVIVPDQLGFGESDKPDIHYSFHQMAANTKALADSLGIKHAVVVGHSMGGMLATRFALMYDTLVYKLVLENPIGLEDYRTFVPYTNIETLYKSELSATYNSYKKYQQSYYPEWKPEYEDLVQQQAKALTEPDFKQTAWANALTYQMIYEQPVCYEFSRLKVPTLLIIGTADRTIVGKAKVPEKLLSKYGQYQLLGKKVHKLIKGSTLKELPGVGHIPHKQQLPLFEKYLGDFLQK